MTEDLIAVAYLRANANANTNPGASIAGQRHTIEEKARQLGARIVAEFCDHGGARLADQPDLQRLLQYVTEHPVRYCIAHTVGQLTRNDADLEMIHLALQQVETSLVVATGDVDRTPSGTALRAIFGQAMDVARSHDLATTITTRMTWKAKQGGTPGKAPLGYLNARVLRDGREINTVTVDPERAPMVTWAFTAYATGDWTMRRLDDELHTRGMTTRQTPRNPPAPVSQAVVRRMLTNPYYTGIVTHRGTQYPGMHDPLTDPATWARVQDVLATQRHHRPISVINQKGESA